MKKGKAALFILLAAAICAAAAAAYIRIRDESSYKMLYLEETASAAEEFSVPQALVLAVIRCESGFDPAAKSRAGAVGLMQLMPDTYREIAVRLGEVPDESLMSDAAVSIRYGAFYIAYLIRCFGETDTALAAYNAGYGNVSGWLADTRYSDDGVRLKKIPFAETDNYVNRVNKAYDKYKKLLSEGRST